MTNEGSELARILQRRRQEVECNGSHFTKDRAQVNSADAACDQRHDSQFTPRSEKQPISRLSTREPSPCPSEPPKQTATRQCRLQASTTPRTPGRVLRSGFDIVEGPTVSENKPNTDSKLLPLKKQLITSTEEAAPRLTMAPPFSPTGSICSSDTTSTVSCCAPARTAEDAKPETFAQDRGTCGSLRSASKVSCHLSSGTASEVESNLTAGEPDMCSAKHASSSVGYCVPARSAVGKLDAAECRSTHTGFSRNNENKTDVASVVLNIAVPSRGLGLGCEISLDHSASSPASSSSAKSVRPAAPLGNVSLWQAVTKGDLQTLGELASKDILSSGRLVATNGHTIFWNAIASQQPKVALFLLDKFPSGLDGGTGVNLLEVHSKRGDTLLHACLHLTDFSEPAAELFRKIFIGGFAGEAAESRGMTATDLKALRCQENKEGQTFFHVAAARLNFWVIRFALSWSPEIASLLWSCDLQGQSPLEVILHRVQAPLSTAVLSPLHASQPAWLDFSKYVPSGVATAFADVELQVEDVVAEGGVFSIMAHRAVLGACSETLHDMLLVADGGRPFRIDPLCCRSRRVLVFALHFVYRASLSCDFADDGFLLWQLLCLCVRYGFPQPLTRYARSTLLRTLSEKKYASIAPVLLQACDKVGLPSEEVCFVACAILRNPEAALPHGRGKEVQDQRTEVLLAALAEVERHALRQSCEGLL